MRKSSAFFRLQATVFATMAFIWVGSVAASQDYEQTPIILHAKGILPKALLKGENYQVVDEVRNDGLINTYQLTTNYGPLKVESTAELMIRVTELRALTAMEEMDRKGVLGDAVVEGVKAPVKGAVDMVTSPVETTKGIFKGTGRFLSSVGRSIVSDDPHQDNALKVALGYDAAKRQFAYRGIMVCGKCGCAITAEIKKGKYIYYHCTGFKGNCDNKYVREEELNGQFAEIVTEEGRREKYTC